LARNVGRKKSLGPDLQDFLRTPASKPNPAAREMADKSDTGKKRKRHTDSSSKPSKRLAIEDQKQVKISLQKADKWAPIIGMRFHMIIEYSVIDLKKPQRLE
jgi:hypothetical protein